MAKDSDNIKRVIKTAQYVQKLCEEDGVGPADGVTTLLISMALVSMQQSNDPEEAMKAIIASIPDAQEGAKCIMAKMIQTEDTVKH